VKDLLAKLAVESDGPVEWEVDVLDGVVGETQFVDRADLEIEVRRTISRVATEESAN
jgi:hypothetical protein